MDILLPVTLASGAAAAILNIWLMVRVGAIRQKAEISIGHGGSDALERRMRAQANFIESTPFVLVLIAAIEIAGKGAPWLAYVAGIYFIGRILHAFGMDGASLKWGRFVGTIVTMLVLLGLGIFAALVAARVL